MYPPEPEFEVVVAPNIVATLTGLLVGYALVFAAGARVTGQPAGFYEALNWAAGVVVLVLLGHVVHELGHVAAAAAVGHRWTKVMINGVGLGVVFRPEPHGWQRVSRAIAGPLAHLAVAVPQLATFLLETAEPLNARTAVYSAWWVAGASNLLVALVSLLPVPAWDGGKVVAGLREVLADRRAGGAGSRERSSGG